jgi:hypothetical protein
MSSTSTKSRGRTRHSGRGARKRRRTEPASGPLAQSAALRQLAAQFERDEQATQDRERQRLREAQAAEMREQAAAQAAQRQQERERRYRDRSRPRVRQEQRMIDLLRRGAGVTQILREVKRPSDGTRDLRRRAEHLLELLEAVAGQDPKTARVRMTRRDLQRTRRFLESVLAATKQGVMPNLAAQPAWLS